MHRSVISVTEETSLKRHGKFNIDKLRSESDYMVNTDSTQSKPTLSQTCPVRIRRRREKAVKWRRRGSKAYCLIWA
jgi:hypothetical protein